MQETREANHDCSTQSHLPCSNTPTSAPIKQEGPGRLKEEETWPTKTQLVSHPALSFRAFPVSDRPRFFPAWPRPSRQCNRGTTADRWQAMQETRTAWCMQAVVLMGDMRRILSWPSEDNNLDHIYCRLHHTVFRNTVLGFPWQSSG